MLEDLLHEASDDGLEVSLAETPVVDSPQVHSEYYDRYRVAVEGVTEVRGGPTFAGGPREPGRPPWHHAEHLTCWSDAAGVIYVGLVLFESTLSLVAGARPHPVEREAITLLPPGA
jgi:hypothetical protein